MMQLGFLINSAVKTCSIFLLFPLLLSLVHLRASLDYKSSVIVSITTYPRRSYFFFLTLISILTQRQMPSHVDIWLSEDNFGNTGFFCRSLSMFPKNLVRVHFVKGDVRSYKKLNYQISRIDNFRASNIKHVVTADDDIIYPFYWLSGLVGSAKKNPNCTICYRMHDILFDENGTFSKYAVFLNNNSSFDKPTLYAIPTGNSGILYPIEYLAVINIENNRYLDYAPNADDIYYRFSLIAEGIACKRVLKNNVHFPSNLLNYTSGLSEENVGANMNDFAISQCSKLLEK